jgi:uncharacterized protein YnzC (UPF0291/DUF896 family)
MKEVDQKTGEDITKRKVSVIGQGPKHGGIGHLTGIKIVDPKEE